MRLFGIPLTLIMTIIFVMALVYSVACGGDDDNPTQDIEEIRQSVDHSQESLDQIEEDVAALATLTEVVDDLITRVESLETVTSATSFSDEGLIHRRDLDNAIDSRFSSAGDGQASFFNAVWQHWNLAVWHLQRGENAAALDNVEDGLVLSGFKGCGNPTATFNEYELPAEIRGLVAQLSPLYTMTESTGESGQKLYAVKLNSVITAGC